MVLLPYIILFFTLIFYGQSTTTSDKQIYSIKKNYHILKCPQPTFMPDTIDKRQLGGQYYLNNQVDNFTLGLWVNYQIPIDLNSQNKEYGLFYFSSDTTDSTSAESTLRFLTITLNESSEGSIITTKISLKCFGDSLIIQIPISMQNQWIYIASTLNIKQSRLELGVIYKDSNQLQKISNTSSQINSLIKLESFPNIGLYPLWTPTSELLCGQVYNFYFFTQSSFFQNDSQLLNLSQITESEVIGHFVLQSSNQISQQIEQYQLLFQFYNNNKVFTNKSLCQFNRNLLAQTSQVVMISGYSQDTEQTNDVQYQQIQNIGNDYYPILSKKRFFSIKQLNIQNIMTLIFDYYTQNSDTDVIFASQSLTRTNLRMLAISQINNNSGLFLNVTIEGQSVIFQTPLQPQQMMSIALNIQCLPPFFQTVLNLRINNDIFEQQSIPDVCFNLQKTNKKVFLGFYQDISQTLNQFKIVSNLIIIKGNNISGLYSQQERKQNQYQIENCEYILQSPNKDKQGACLKCGGNFLLYKNRCVESKDCYILDEQTKQPLYSQVIGNNCFVDCFYNQIQKHDVLCDYDFLVQSDIVQGQVILNSDQPSQTISNLIYTDIPQIFIALNGMNHDGATQGYNLQLLINNILPTQFDINFIDITNKKYQSIAVSYLTAPTNSKKVEIGTYQLDDTDLIQQNDQTLKIYQISFRTEKLYIPNVLISVVSYQGQTNSIKLAPQISNISYTGFQVEIPQYQDSSIITIQYIAFRGKLFEKELSFANNNINGWGSQPENSTFRYLNTLNYTFIERVDPQIQLFSMISGIIKTDDTYQGIDVENRNNTINYGKLVVDYVQSNKSALLYFKSSSFILYNSCEVSACLFTTYDDSNIIGYDRTLIENQNQPLKTGSGLRQIRNRIIFTKYFQSIPQIFLYYEQINIPEESATEGIQFEFRGENISYDGFDLVYEVYNNFLLKGLTLKYFATESSNILIDTVEVSTDLLSLQPTDSQTPEYYSYTALFKNPFQQVPLVMVSVYSYSGDADRKLKYNILVDTVTTNQVSFKIQIQQGILSVFKFQYIAALKSSYTEIQSLNSVSFEETPIGRNFDPQPIIPDQTVTPPSDPNTIVTRRQLQTSPSDGTTSGTGTDTTSVDNGTTVDTSNTGSSSSSTDTTGSNGTTTDTTNTGNNGTTTSPQQQETIILNNWSTKYWDRWNITSYQSICQINTYSSNPNILYPIQELELGTESQSDVSFMLKGGIIKKSDGQFYYDTKLNVEHQFLKSLGVSMMGALKHCPDWCVQCNENGVCIQCKSSILKLPDCTCKDGYTLDSQYGCIQCIDGCCKSELNNKLCNSCSHSSLVKQLNCGCPTNQQMLYIAWKNQIQLNVTLVNGGDQDQFTLLGCDSCTQVKTNRTIILTQSGQQTDYFAVYSNLVNSLGNLEYEVSILIPPQYICYGSIKQEKTFMIGLSASEKSKSSFNFDHLQNSMSFCSDRKTYIVDGDISLYTPVSLNWQKKYSLKYINNTFKLRDIASALDIFSTSFYLTYSISTISGSPPNFITKCESYSFAKFGKFKNLKRGLNDEVVKDTVISSQQIYSVDIFDKNIYSDSINIVIQGWFYMNNLKNGVFYSLFEIISEDSNAKIGVSCTLDSILLSYENPPDTIYKKSNFPAFIGLNNIGDQWFYLSLEWVNGKYQSSFTLKLTHKKGLVTTGVRTYTENTAPFIFSGQKLNLTVNNDQYFSNSQWNGKTMDFGYYRLLNTQSSTENSLALAGLDPTDTIQLFQKSYQGILFFYEFTSYNFNINKFIKDYSKNNNSYMEDVYLTSVDYKIGLKVVSSRSFTIPTKFYVGKINEDYGFVIGFTIIVHQISPFEGAIFRVGFLMVRFVLYDGLINQSSSTTATSNKFYNLQFCVQEVECVNSQKIRIPINGSAYGLAIQIRRSYIGNQRLLSISIYSENDSEENIMFVSPQATTGFNSFSQTPEVDNNIFIRVGSSNNEFNNPSNYLYIRRVILQSGSYVKPSTLLIQNKSEEDILAQVSATLGSTLSADEKNKYIMLNRLKSLVCLVQLGKENEDKVCVKCNQNFENVFGVCVSNGECSSYSISQPYEKSTNNGAFYFDYVEKKCLPCNANCQSCQFSADNCLACSFGYVNAPICKSCPYKEGNPTFFDPDTQLCVSQCSSKYCTDTINQVCIKCDGAVRRLFEDFNTSSNLYNGDGWFITNKIIDQNKRSVVNCFINQYYLTFYGGGGTLDGSSVISKQVTGIPLHYSIKYTFILLISQSSIVINSVTISNILQMKLDDSVITTFNIQPLIENSMICSDQQPSSSAYKIITTVAHIQSKAHFDIGFNFVSNPSASPSLWWGIRYFSIDILQCHYSCFTCYGPGEQECLSCNEDLIFVYGRCICPLNTQYIKKLYTCWGNPCYSCETCAAPCIICGNDNVCLQCANGMKLYEGKCYSDCVDIPQNLRFWPTLINDNINRLCVPFNLTENIYEFQDNSIVNVFKYTKGWLQTPILTPGQYLFQCGTDNFVGPFTNTVFQKNFSFVQPYYSLKAQIEILILNNWASSSTLNIKVNNNVIQTIQSTNLQTPTAYTQCPSYSSQLTSITTNNYYIGQTQFQLTLSTQNFDSIQWALRKIAITASLCPIYCSQCNTQNQCTQCVEGGIIDSSSRICICPPGYIHSLKPQCSVQPCGQCLQCHQSCQNCSGPGPFSCIKCKKGFKRIGLRCVENCPSNYYLDVNKEACFLCDSSCFNCFGQFSNNCISCYAPQVLESNYCVDKCTLAGQFEDSFSRSCLPEISPDMKIFLSDPLTFSDEINSIYSSQNPSLPQKFYTCGSQLFAGPFNTQLILQIQRVQRHSQIIMSLDVFTASSTTLAFSSNQSFLATNFKQTITLSSSQTCSSQNLTIQKVVAYINSFENYYAQQIYITITSSSSSFSIKNIQFQTINCHLSCLTCKGPLSTDCLSCVDGASIQPDNSCQCNKKDYFLMFIQGSLSDPINSECKKCKYPCTTCFSDDNYSCKSCETGFYLKDFSCVTSCPPLKYQQLDDLGICQKCSFPCDECTSDGKNCLNCLEGYVLTISRKCEESCWESQYVDQNNTCQSCDLSCYSCNGPNASDCLDCNIGYYRNDQTGICLPCHEFCTQCTDSTNMSCSECQQGIIHYNNTICTQDCTEIPGNYPQDDTCLPCNSECKRCDGPSFSNCLQCQDGKALVNGLCTDCDPSCTTCFGNTSDQCYSCSDGYLLQGHSCVQQCYSGYYGKNKVCNPCHDACSLCYGDQNDQCFSCNYSYYFSNNTCIPCHPYCSICYGPLSTDCLYCSSGSYLLSTQCYGGVEGCPQGYYGDNKTRKCTQCDQSCYECQGQSQYLCLSCPLGSYLTKVVYDMDGNLLPSTCSKCPLVCQQCTVDTQCTQCQCLLDCPAGYYENLNSGQCQSCVNNCATCEGYNAKGNFICTSCVQKYYLDSTYACQPCGDGCFLCKSNTSCIKCLEGYFNYNGVCQQQCPLGYYPNSQQECIQCIKPCNVCSSPTMCKACQIGYYLQNEVIQSVITSSKCQRCNSICQNCTGGTANDCVSCKSPLSLQGNVCQQQCNIGYYSNGGVCYLCNDNCLQCSSSTYCDVCEQGYISINGICSFCDYKCSSCFGLGDQQCNSCIAPYYLYKSSCQLTCPDQFFKNIRTDSNNVQRNECTKCSSSCYNCNGTQDNQCTSCLDRYYLTSSFTCSQCSTSCKTCSSSSTSCTSCPLGQFLMNQNCMKVCPDTYYGDDQDSKCKQCNSPCKTCTGSGINQCSTCLQAYFFNQGQCLACHENCLSCYGIESTQCFSCQMGMKKEGDSCISCGSGMYYDINQSQCQQCNTVCKTCYGGSFQNCSSCVSGKYLQDSKCNICPSSCSNCTSENLCTSCVNGYYLLNLNIANQICIKQCPYGLEVKSGSQECGCTSNCLVCPVDSQSLDVKCTKCVTNNFVIDLYNQDSSYSCIQTSQCKGFIDIQTTSCVQECPSQIPFINMITRQCLQTPCPSDSFTFYVSGQGQCLSSCPQGYYSNEKQICSPCHPLCLQCTGPTSEQCTKCANGVLYHPSIKACSETCLVGYIQDTNTGFCVVCYTFCKACLPNLVFLNGLCLDDCPVGYSQTASMKCIESSSQLAKISNKFDKPVSITKDVVLEATVFALGPIKSIEWVLRKSTDQEFNKNFELISVDSLTLNIPFLALKSSQYYQFRIEIVLASKDILNDEISFTTSGEINRGSFIATPTSGEAGSTVFQFSIEKYKYPLPLQFDLSYYILQLQYSNTIADDGSIVKQKTPDFVKKGLVQIYSSIKFDQGQTSTLTYVFPINFENDQSVAIELKMYSIEGAVETFDYMIINVKKTLKADQSILEFNSNNVFDAISYLNYSLNLREVFQVDPAKELALQQNNSINMQIALSRKKTYNSKAQCDSSIDCFGQGTCVNDSNQYTCSCTKGFLGSQCQWLESDYIFLNTNVPKYISYTLSSDAAIYSDIIKVQAIGNIFYYNDFNQQAIDLANLFISIVDPKIDDTLDQVQIQIYQTICKYLITSLQDNYGSLASTQITKLQNMDQNIKSISSKNLNMGEALSQQTPVCDSIAKPISVQMVSTSSDADSSTPAGRRHLRRLQQIKKLRRLQSSSSTKSTIPVVFRDLTVSIPPQVIDTTKKVVVSGSSFKKDPRANPLAITTTISLSLGGNNGQQSVQDAPQPFVLTIPKKVPSPPGTNTEAIQCTYYDEDTNSYKSDGCTFVKETITNIVCSCTHLTDFSAAFQPEQIKNAISLSEMKSAQLKGNALLSSKSPSIISIVNLPTPKIGQRNVNLINAVNIQMSGGIYNVLAKQVFIVSKDGEDYEAYNMWDQLFEESVEGLIQKQIDNQPQITISEEKNITVGQFIIIGMSILGFLFKVGNRAAFNFKFVDEDEAPSEEVLNTLHKQNEVHQGQENQIQIEDEESIEIKNQVERNDNDYENSIVTIAQKNKLNSKTNSPKEVAQMHLQQDEVFENLSTYQQQTQPGVPGVVQKRKSKLKTDEVTKKTMILKKKYEQEKRLLQILEKVQEGGSEDIQSQMSKMTVRNPGRQQTEYAKDNQSIQVKTPKFSESDNNNQQSGYQQHNTKKKSQFVKQAVDHDIESQMSQQSPISKKNLKASQFSEKNSPKIESPSPQSIHKKQQKEKTQKIIFQKLSLENDEFEMKRIDSPKQQKDHKQKKHKKNHKDKTPSHKNKLDQQNQEDNHERVMTTEVDDDTSLIIVPNIQKSNTINQDQPTTPKTGQSLKKSKFSQVMQNISNFSEKVKMEVVQSFSNSTQKIESIKQSSSIIAAKSNQSPKLVSNSGESQLRMSNSLHKSKIHMSQSLNKVSGLVEQFKQTQNADPNQKKFQNEQLENELAILRMRENVQKEKQKITSKNINPIYSIFGAKETLFQTKMSRMLYFFITLYGYLAFDLFIYKWGKENLREEPFVNYLFYFNPYRIVLIIMFSNIASHTLLGFINHIFSVFVKKLGYEEITIKMLNKLRSHHLLCYICMFISMYSIYSATIYDFAQTKYFSISEIQEIMLETFAAQFIDSLIFDGFLVLFHLAFIDLLPDNMQLKTNFETFQSQRGFFYTKKTEHSKVLDLIL